MKKFTVKIISLVLAVILLSSSLTAFAGENKLGIDVSYHNSSVDYVQQVNDGKSFVMIRLGYFNHLDTEFWSNVKDVCDAGMDFGVYLYSYAYSLEEAQIEADFVLNTLSEMPEEYKENFVLPVAYDVEDSTLTKYGKAQLTAQTMLFCGEMEKAGYVPMVYANTNWFNNYLDINQIVDKGYKIWLANWVSNPSFTSKKEVGTTGIYADMWQYADGNADNGGFDQNVLYDLEDLKHIFKPTVNKATTSANGKITYDNCPLCSEAKEDTIIYYPKTITLSATSYTYDGSAKKPTVTVKDSAGKTISSSNYTVAYSNNVNAGTATATITFKGNYTGTVKKTYTIKKKALSSSNSTVTLSATSYTYDGKVKAPSVTVKYGSKKLVKGTDYTVTYSSGRKNVGKYNVKITFKGNYSGTITKTFTIKPKNTSISSVTAKSKGFTVKWKKYTTQTTGYQIQYSTSSKFTNAKTVTITKNSTTSKTISKLSAKKKYYVRIRTYKTVSGTKYYSSWSSAKSVTTKK